MNSSFFLSHCDYFQVIIFSLFTQFIMKNFTDFNEDDLICEEDIDVIIHRLISDSKHITESEMAVILKNVRFIYISVLTLNIK